MALLPTFIVAGAAKTGTTWLHECLTEHPKVHVPHRKELRFFSYNYGKGPEWYENFFDPPPAVEAVGELSPSYLSYPSVPERIHDWNRDTKLIFIFRDPVARAYSAYCMLLRAGKVSEKVENVLQPGTRLVDEGFYDQHLNRFDDYFSNKNIKCLVYDDLKQNPHKFLRDVFTFIGVDASFEPSILKNKYHARKSRPKFVKVYNGLVKVAKVMQKSHLLNNIVRLVRRSGLVNIFHWLNKGPEFPTLSSAKKRELAELYKDDVEALSARMKRDLSVLWLDRYLKQR